MKLTKPFNQLRSILRSAMGASAYRFLSIFIAALLFCGMNSQLVAAASVVPGANADSNNNALASGDSFNSESFLQASNPNADANQHWTWGEEIGAGILGVAALGGLVAGGYKYHADRNAKMEEQQGDAVLRDRDSSRSDDLTAGSSSARSEVPSAVDTTVTENEDPANADADTTPGWRQKASDAFTSLRQGVWSLGQGAYNLAPLKSCWPAKEVPEKPILDHLTEAHTAQLKKVLAEQLAQRPLLTKLYDMFALTKHALPDERTEWQKRVQEMERIGKMPNGQATLQQGLDFNEHTLRGSLRKQGIDSLTTESTLDQITHVLDPETANELKNLRQYYNQNQELNIPEFTKLAYFVAKNSDSIHPGHLKALTSAFQEATQEVDGDAGTAEQQVVESRALVQKMHAAVAARWNEDNIAVK